MVVPTKPNSVTEKTVAEQVGVSPRTGGHIAADITVKNGKANEQVKRKKVDEDEIQNSNGEVSATPEDDAAELAGAQDGPILLAQAEAATVTDAAATGSAAAGAEAGAAGAAAGSGVAAGAAAGATAI